MYLQFLRRKALRLPLIFGWLLAMAGFTAMMLLTATGQETSQPRTIPREDEDACMACHATGMNGRHAVNLSGLKVSPHKDLKCQDCHYTITAAPHTPEMLKEKASCGTCHAEAMEALSKSAHSKPDRVAGDHPTCIICHGNGDAHAISADRLWPRQKKVALCSNCHRKKELMRRYGPDVDAVPSYEESFHGKALLRFGNLKVAICSDCHGHHDVLPPENPLSPTHRDNAAKTCAQSGCHAGAKINFAMSGANHLRLKLKESPVLWGELLFFRTLIFCVITGMLCIIALDLRKELFGPPPPCGRSVAFFISVSFLFMVLTLALATLERRGALQTWLIAVGAMALAFIVYFLERKPQTKAEPEKHYLRLPPVLRWQHICLMVSFTLLALTGLPMRFAAVEGVPRVHLLFDGFAGARYTHRVAAVILILTWLWHLGWLLVRWHRAGYSFQSWTMLPNRQDWKDFKTAFRYYLGLSHEEPKYGRFQLREKLDYLAEYWGIPIMICTGFILWFPIYWGNRLPEIGLSFAYIAHSYEATLAFLAIITWHLYNAHFNPSTFPMNRVWLTGMMSRSEMEREHPLELAQLEGDSAESSASSPLVKESGTPIPVSAPASDIPTESPSAEEPDQGSRDVAPPQPESAEGGKPKTT